MVDVCVPFNVVAAWPVSISKLGVLDACASHCNYCAPPLLQIVIIIPSNGCALYQQVLLEYKVFCYAAMAK